METYLSHVSAAYEWDIPYLRVVLGYQSREQLREAAHSKIQRSSLDPKARVRDPEVEAHYKALPLPKGAVVKHKGEWVASPELVFLDLAGKLNFHQAVLLGLQLCASDAQAQGRPLLTTVKKLRAFLDACHGHHGCKAAAKAARYVADNSWSIMESLLYMTLVLPNQYGGYGLKGATLNQELRLKEKGAGQKTNQVFADLYWERAKLVVEYDSRQHHDSEASWLRDTRRITTLESNGYKTLTVTASQLYSDEALREVAQVIARALGRRISIRTARFTEQKAQLRGLLPRHDALFESLR